MLSQGNLSTENRFSHGVICSLDLKLVPLLLFQRPDHHTGSGMSVCKFCFLDCDCTSHAICAFISTVRYRTKNFRVCHSLVNLLTLELTLHLSNTKETSLLQDINDWTIQPPQYQETSEKLSPNLTPHCLEKSNSCRKGYWHFKCQIKEQGFLLG